MAIPALAVIFDLDDTVFDHTGSVEAALAAWLPRRSVAEGRALARVWFELEQRHHGEWQAGLVSFDEQRRRRVRDLWRHLGRPSVGDDDLDRLFGDYLSHYEHAWRAFDDARPALAQLVADGVTTAVLTNGSVRQQNAKVEACGLGGLVDLVVTSEELGVAKPEPAAFLRTCARLGVEPGQSLMVGDRFDVDVLGARAAGLHALHLDRRDAGDERAAQRIADLGALSTHLERRSPPPSR